MIDPPCPPPPSTGTPRGRPENTRSRECRDCAARARGSVPVIGAAEAIPALQTQISSPPKRRATSCSSAPTAFSSVTSTHEAATRSRPLSLTSAASAAASASRSISQHDHRSPIGQKPPRRRHADAPGAAGDQRHAAGQGAWLRLALQLRLLKQPIFNVERLLLRRAPDRSRPSKPPRMTLIALT